MMSPLLWASGTGRALAVATQLAVGYFLTPGQFGEFAVASSLCNFLSLFQSGDLTRLALQDFADRSRSAAAMRSVLLLGSVVTGSSILALVYFNPGKFNPWFAGCLVLLPFLRIMANTRITLLSAQGDVKKIAMAASAEALTRSTVAIALAIAGFGGWSLVIGEIGAVAAALITLNHCCAGPGDAPPVVGPAALQSLSMATLSSVLNLIERELPVLAIGVMLDSAQAGNFAFAHRIATQMIIVVLPMIAIEAIPRLLAAGTEPSRFEAVRAVERSRLRKVCWVLIPLLGLCAPAAIYFLWGERWIGAVQTLPILVLAIGFRIAYLFNRGVLEAEGRMRAILALSLLDAGLIVCTVGASLQLGGRLWLASSMVLEALVAYLISRAILSRIASPRS